MIRHLLRLVGLVVILSTPAISQELYYLALQQPGQAAVAFDGNKKTAYIIDLGKAGDGDRIVINGHSLIEELNERHIENLVIVCSHPHSDHMGGLRALFSDPKTFFTDAGLTTKRFQTIRIAENGMRQAESLVILAKSVVPASIDLEIKAIQVGDPKKAVNLSEATDQVFVRTLPYTTTNKAGAHGNSVVSLIVLGGTETILDPDDAETNVLRQISAYLTKEGIKPTTIIVPHHGSKAHDIGALLALGPTRAIIPVNPANPYGHPTAEILSTLIEKLGTENVLFTGSATETLATTPRGPRPGGFLVEHVLLGPGGVLEASHRASDALSYAEFVDPGRRRLERKGGLTKADRLLYETLRAEMGKVDGGTATQASAVERMVEARVEREGTMLSPEFELGGLTRGGVVGSPRAVARPVFRGHSEATLVRVSQSADRVAPLSSQERALTRQAAAVEGVRITATSLVEVRHTTDSGVDNRLFPMALVAAGPPAGVEAPPGGMVYLRGGRVLLSGNELPSTAADLIACCQATPTFTS